MKYRLTSPEYDPYRRGDQCRIFLQRGGGFGLKGEGFFWEPETLIDIMLLGHWIEMRSVLGASRALEELVKITPRRRTCSKTRIS